ncbi:MAG: FAD-binding oxidoreductase [Thiobacillus sp.]|nr:FAD-binding oxidoreductase [Thiobacillus sp.]
MHIVIAGNGILAQSIAFELIHRHPAARVTIVGKSDRIGSATLAAAAMLNSFAEIEKGALETEFDRYRFELSQKAARAWPGFAQRIIDAAGSSSFSATGTSPQFDSGTFVLNNAAADDLDDENFEAILAALRDYNEPHAFVNPGDVPNYQPEQRYRALRCVYIEREGWMNPGQVVSSLDEALRGSGRVVFENDNVFRLVHGNGRVTGFESASGKTIVGDVYLLATGATLSDLLAASGLALPIQRVFYGMGVSIKIRSVGHPHTHCVRTPNRGLACGVYTAPHSHDTASRSGDILIGATNLISPEPLHAARVANVESLLKAAIQQINTHFYRAELTQVNVGWRPTSLDTQPLLGKTSIDNLFVASGTKRDGFHMAPVIASNMSSMLLGEQPESGFSWFDPERKPLRLLTRQAAVEKAVRHQMSAAYQHGFTPPTSRMPDLIRQKIRDDVERLHDDVGAHDWGIPPEMLDMYRYGHARA